MEKISEEKLNELLLDEKQAFVEYAKLGLSNLARDEKKHYNYLKKLKRQLYGR